MKKFLLHIIIFCCLLTTISSLSDYLITSGLRKSKAFHFIDWNNIYDGKINADLIINGNSKAWHHISPKIIDSTLKLNSYNLGLDGYDFVMQKARYDIYKKNNTSPKVIIQVVGINTLQMRENLFQKIQFTPYLKDSTLQRVTKQYIGMSFWDYNLPLIRYASYPEVIIDGFFSFFNIHLFKDNIKYKGYEAYDKQWDKSFSEFKKMFPSGRKYPINEKSKNLFERYLSSESKNNTAIFLVYSPTYFESQKYVTNKSEIINLYKHYGTNSKIYFLDYSNHYLTKSKDFFYNSQHLNKKGAELFSAIVAKDIQQILSFNKNQ